MQRKLPFHAATIPRGDYLVARRYIDDQIALVATFTPGSDAHRNATEILLLLQDGLDLLIRSREMARLVQARLARPL